MTRPNLRVAKRCHTCNHDRWEEIPSDDWCALEGPGVDFNRNSLCDDWEPKPIDWVDPFIALDKAIRE